MNRLARAIGKGAVIGMSLLHLTEVGSPPALAQSADGKSDFGYKAGSVFRDCPQCPELVVLPVGSFAMGSPSDERGRSAVEGPQQSISLKAPFGVGRFPVTFDEWDICVAGGGCNGYQPSDSGWARGRNPVINVSLTDARAYVSWLSSKTGKHYRLPSEAEREYFARAGTRTPFSWGMTPSAEIANYNSSTSDIYGGQPREPRRKTVHVDSFKANPWGLYGIHGNVWEWTTDCWSPTLEGVPADGSSRQSPDCERYALRGGSFSDFPRDIRSASRISHPPDSRSSNIGFRVVRSLP